MQPVDDFLFRTRSSISPEERKISSRLLLALAVNGVEFSIKYPALEREAVWNALNVTLARSKSRNGSAFKLAPMRADPHVRLFT